MDSIDGGPVPLRFPNVETGVGLKFPASTVFGERSLGVSIETPLASVRVKPPRAGFNTYGFIEAGGMASTLLFVVVYLGRVRRKAAIVEE